MEVYGLKNIWFWIKHILGNGSGVMHTRKMHYGEKVKILNLSFGGMVFWSGYRSIWSESLEMYHNWEEDGISLPDLWKKIGLEFTFGMIHGVVELHQRKSSLVAKNSDAWVEDYLIPRCSLVVGGLGWVVDTLWVWC